jgi:general secretion pathway protein G
MKVRKGFTLVEILIVVVILGILAAIVIPQFSNASTDAKENSLKSNLQTIRSQIELYKIQHNDNLPGAGTASFTEALTETTDVDGTTSGDAYGPYLKSMPANPFNNDNTVSTGTATSSPGDDSSGWYFNTDTGDFWANNDDDPNHLDY